MSSLPDSVPLWVAHLAYNYHVRVGLLVLSTPVQCLELVVEDVLAGLDCCEYLTSKLGIMGLGSSCHQLWCRAREAIVSYLNNRMLCFVEEVKAHMGAATSQLASELSEKVSTQLVAIFNHFYLVQLAAGVCTTGEMLVPRNISRYLDSFDDIPSGCMSGRYMESIERIQSLLLKSFDVTLPRVDVLRIGEIAIWQSRNFIYHFRSEVVDGLQSNPLSQVGLHGLRPTLVSRTSSGDEDEKADVSEKRDSEKPFENDCATPFSCATNEAMEWRATARSEEATAAGKYSHSVVLDVDGSFVDCCSQPGTTVSMQEIQSCLHSSCSREEVRKLRGAISCLISADLSQQAMIETELEDLQSALSDSSELPDVVCQSLERALNEKTSNSAVIKDRLLQLEQLMVHTTSLLCHDKRLSLRFVGHDVAKVLRDILENEQTGLNLTCLIRSVLHLLSSEEVRNIGCVLGASADQTISDLAELLS